MTDGGEISINNANIAAAERLKNFSNQLLNANSVAHVPHNQPPPPPGPPPLANMSQVGYIYIHIHNYNLICERIVPNSQLTPEAQAAIQQAQKSTAFRNLPRLCSFWLGE